MPKYDINSAPKQDNLNGYALLEAPNPHPPLSSRISHLLMWCPPVACWQLLLPANGEISKFKMKA